MPLWLVGRQERTDLAHGWCCCLVPGEGEGWDLGPLSIFGVFDGHCEGGELVAEAVRDGIQQEARRALEDELKKLKQQKKADQQGWYVPRWGWARRRLGDDVGKLTRCVYGGVCSYWDLMAGRARWWRAWCRR